MRRITLGLVGALAFSGVAAAWDAFCERNFDAAAPVALHAANARERVDIAAARALLTTESVLRRAALRPEAAAAIDRRTRPGRLDSLLSLVGPAPSRTDTMGRAVAYLADRVDVRSGAWPEMIEIVVRMPAAAEAAAVATAVAEAFAADVNDTWLAARRRDAEQRAAALERSTRRLDEAKDRLQALRASDPAPVATLAPGLAVGTGKALDRLKGDAVAAAVDLEAASRVYGPRHPQLLARQSEARRARMALEAAATGRVTRGRTAEIDAPPVVGGPDPRAADIALAEQRVAEAQGAYDVETSRREAERREARVLKPASPPARPAGGLGGAMIALAGAFGFIAFFGAPAVTQGMRPHMRIRDRAIGRLRDGAIVDGRHTIKRLGIADADSARRILVTARTGSAAGEAAAALARTAILEGWRPLLVQLTRNTEADAAMLRAVRIGDEKFGVRTGSTVAGPLDMAMPAARLSKLHASCDAATAYDCIVAFAAESDLGKTTLAFDCLVAVGRALSDARATRLMKVCRDNVSRYAGASLA